MAKLDNMFSKVMEPKTEAHPKRVTKWIHYSKLVENEDQYKDKTLARERAENLADLISLDGEVLQDLLVRKLDSDEYEIIAGHHRYLACKLLIEERGEQKYEFLPCIVESNISDVRARFQLYSSNGYATLTQYERMHELEQMKHLLSTYPDEFPELQGGGDVLERLASHLNMKRSTIGEYLTIANNLSEKGMEEFKSGNLKKSAAVELATMDEEEQDRLLEQGVTSLKDIKKVKKEDCSFSADDCSITIEEFLIIASSWEVCAKNEYAEEIFYRYRISDYEELVVKEYPKNGDSLNYEGYHLTGNTKHFHDGEVPLEEVMYRYLMVTGQIRNSVQHLYL